MLIAVLLLSGCDERPESVAAHTFTIGLITNNPNGLMNVEGFREGLHALGYAEGENAVYLYSGKATPKADLTGEIATMIAEGAQLIFTAGTPTGVAAREATQDSSVSVVFGVIADPVAAGVMTDLNRPGGNMTGVMLSKNQARRLELLHLIAPRARRVLVAYNPDDAAPISALGQIENVAPALGLELIHAPAHSDSEVTELLADFPQGIDAVFMLPDSTVNRRVKDLVAVATDRDLPVSAPSSAQIDVGAIMSYGIDHRDVGLQASRIADRILRGADPATIPVETASFFFTLNVASADRIRLELSDETLQQADRVVHEDHFDR